MPSDGGPEFLDVLAVGQFELKVKRGMFGDGIV